MKTLTSYELSQFLSLILRHKPETINLDLDEYGYVDIDKIIANSTKLGYTITEKEIRTVVAKSDKQRFKIIKNRIKANQGHTIEIKLEEQSQMPPDILYHGTKFKLKDDIVQQGLLRMKRNFVHLYEDYYSSFMTGNRTKNVPIVFEIDSKKMYNDGYDFFISDNNVWQTKHVPKEYLKIIKLDEIESLDNNTFTKTTFYTKMVNEDFRLDPNFNSQPFIYIYNCYICGCEKSTYRFNKEHIICEELTYDRPKKSHSLLGKIISFEQIQDGKEIKLISTFEVKIRKESKLRIKQDTNYQGIGIRFHCPICNEQDFISNMTNLGKIFRCRTCQTDLLRVDKPTEILQAT